ncbi:hypothetical protein P8C59_000270 [Phyllachora maydis]|uniref:Uncharacterized protein n=1 Tax=Phyllachora maydis TaxID=1825666 RepID=A0AAD9HXA3_9PEZI|nr:hypothetical protein P8C59_000270 [Phyllachora maydis]
MHCYGFQSIRALAKTRSRAHRVAPSAGAAVGGGHVEEFDFERTLDAIRSLETGLSPLSHSIALLRSERDKEEAALEREFDALRRLEANARSEAHSWREREKRLHVLTTEGTILDPEEDGPSGKLALVKAMDRPNGSVFKSSSDDEAQVLSRQLASHMESMSGNLAQIGGLLPAMMETRAALQVILQQTFDSVNNFEGDTNMVLD